MKKRYVLLFLFCVACGKATSKKEAVYDAKIDLNEQDFIESLPSLKLEAPVDPIPPSSDTTTDTPLNTKAAGVGVLNVITEVTEESTFTKNCTATVINGDELITAAHCVPESENGPQDFCSKMYFSHSSEEKIFKCSKVLWSSVEMDKSSKDTTPDILIIKLHEAPQNIRSFTLEENFADNNATYKALLYSPNEMDETKTTNKDLLKPFQAFNFASYTSCKFRDGPLVEYPFRTFDCPITAGNSGAPFINKKNKIQGIIGGCRDTKKTGICSGDKEEGGYLTDVACLEKVDGQYQWKSSCPKSGPTRVVR